MVAFNADAPTAARRTADAPRAASGMAGEDDKTTGFDERLRMLVIAALAGKDVAEATRLEEESIDKAKAWYASPAQHHQGLGPEVSEGVRFSDHWGLVRWERPPPGDANGPWPADVVCRG